MKITNNQTDSGTIVSFEGKLDTNTCAEAQAHLDGLLNEGVKKVLVDFGKLDFVSSAGLRVLLATAKQHETSGGELRIFGLNETVGEIFEISGFSVILNVFESEQDALETI